MERRQLGRLACCLALVIIPSFVGFPASAVDDLRYELAVLREGLDAGISRDEFHKLRIEIGARIRISSEDQRQVLKPFLDKLVAADAIWMGSQTGECSLENPNGNIRDGKSCVRALSPFYKVLGLDVPSSSGSSYTMYPSIFIRPVLPEIAEATDLALGLVK